MRVWHRLHVFAQVLNVLCVIGDIVPVVEHPPRTAIIFAVSNASDTTVVESSTTSQSGITGNFQKSAEGSSTVSGIVRIRNDFSSPKPEVTWSTAAHVETSTPKTEPKKEVERSRLFAARSLDLVEVDFDNVIEDTSDDSKAHSHHHSHFTTTKKIESQSSSAENLEPSLSTTEEAEPYSSTTDKSETNPSTTDKAETNSSTTDKAETNSSTTDKAETNSSTTEKAEPNSSTTVKAEPSLSTTEKEESNSSTTEKAKPNSTTTENPEASSTTTENPEAHSTTTENSETNSIATEIPEPDSTTTDNPTPDSTTTENPTPDSTTTENPTPDSTTTEEPKLPECILVTDYSTPRSVDNVTTSGSTIKPVEETEGNIGFVNDLMILEKTTESLSIFWELLEGNETLQYYEVQWHQKETLVGSCRISTNFMYTATLIESLKACTNYRVTVQPFFEFTPGAAATINSTTDFEVNKDSVKLGVAGVGSEWIEISWTMPCTDCVSLYIINVCEGEKCVVAKIDKTTYNKTELDPGRTYTFELTIEGNEGAYGSINVTATTTVPKIKDCEMVTPSWPSATYFGNGSPVMLQLLEATPSKILQAKEGEVTVEELYVVDTLPTGLTVTWKRPNDTLEVSYYVIEWYKDDDKEISTCKVSNQTFGYHISSLVPCTTYTVRVMPHLEAANGTRRVVSGTTGLNVHKDTLNLKVADQGPDWLKISWNMPSTDCVTHYSVNFCEADNCTVHQTNNTTYYEKKNLSPCTTYDFNLTVYGSSDVAYGSLNISGTTDFLAPGKPSPATTVSGNYSLRVSWPKPEGYTCIKHYRVVWSRDGRTADVDTTENALLLQGLEPCATYEIIITAVNINSGDSLPERIRSNATAPAVTDPPVMIWGPTITATEISINWWIRTNRTNNCAPAKLVVDCQHKETLGIGYTSVDGRSDYDIPASSQNERVNTTVKKISPFTRYECQSYTFNVGGRSADSQPLVAQTLEAVPTAPKLLPESVSNVTNTSITLQWKRPEVLPGILQKWTIHVIWHYNRTHRPSWCIEPDDSDTAVTIDGSVLSYVYPAIPFSLYRIKIAAATGAGWGPSSEPERYNTKPGAPGRVSDLDCRTEEKPGDPDSLETSLTWGIPCFFNSKQIEHFRVLGRGHRVGFEQHDFSQIVNYTNDHCFNDTCSLMLGGLREEHTYDIEVTTKGVDYNELGERSRISIVYPAGIPPQPSQNYTNIITIDPYKARRTTTTATVLLPVFPDTAGDIKCYAIIVSKIGHNNASFGRLKEDTCTVTKANVATWREAYDRDFEIPYEATKFAANSLQSNIENYGRFKAVKFVLGEDEEACPKISSMQRSYCNGPLKPDTVYHVRMRAFTAGGYSDSIVFTVKTNAELQVALVIGTIFGILFLGILITMMLLVRKCSLQAVLRRFLHSDMPGSPVPAPFTRRKFITHCQQLADNPGKLSNEYQLLQTLSVDLQMPTNAACLQANRKKNRYTDILPYDFSRVKLEVIDNDPNTDYINASFIKGFTGEEDYIACQGPKEETTYDFWRMIDQYDIKLIVMLTQLVEKNKEKCHQYFPTIRETFTYENMAIRCSMELDYRTYTQRTLVLQKENSRRTIIHLHFKDWPDHDVPEDFDPMINFCQIMRRHMEASRGLVVIHCSAGIGRTGTLIAIDILLQHIKDNRKLDVFGTVYRLRHHRINMVQRESQYAYIYNCIRQVLKNPYFSKTYKPPSVDPIGDNNSHKKKEASESNTDLVSSFETLKKSSFSTSVESAEPIYQTPSKSSSKSRTCYSLSGLRCAKSTGAIDTRPYQQNIARYNTHDHPISEIANDALLNSSDISLEITDSEGSTTSIYENMQPLTRSKSAHAFDRDEDSCVTQKLLEHDTTL